jgi:hypothetical protein
MTERARAMSGAWRCLCFGFFWILITMLPTIVLMTATVPMVMSLEVAKAQYKMKPTKDVYRPYSAGSFANRASGVALEVLSSVLGTLTSHALGNHNKPDGDTRDDIANEPCQIVVEDPIPERKKAPEISLDRTTRGLELPQVFCCSRIMFNV